MKVLVIGSGGREHALVWKLRQSPRVSQVYCAPGNGGIAEEAECLPADVKSIDSLVAVANQVRPDLTVVGPELPLALGVVDRIYTKRGWRVFGPSKAAAQLESSKSFAKEFMQRHRIPTAHFAICDSIDEVLEALPHFHPPVVVKADGLAAGKGVVICKTKEEAASAAAEMFSGKTLGEAGRRVVLEECLQRGRAFLSGAERWRESSAAGGGAGSQAHRGWRHRPQHRRHGRLFHSEHRGRPDDAVAVATRRAAGGGRHEGGRARSTKAFCTAG